MIVADLMSAKQYVAEGCREWRLRNLQQRLLVETAANYGLMAGTCMKLGAPDAAAKYALVAAVLARRAFISLSLESESVGGE